MFQSKSLITAVSRGGLVFLISAVIFLGKANGLEKSTEEDCRIHTGSCTATVKGIEVTLDIHPKPVKAMEDLTFTVIISGKGPFPLPHIDLGMPGMNMGPNQVRLTRRGENRFQGTGVIVRCPSGSRTWRAVVTIPGFGEAEFIFDVVY